MERTVILAGIPVTVEGSLSHAELRFLAKASPVAAPRAIPPDGIHISVNGEESTLPNADHYRIEVADCDDEIVFSHTYFSAIVNPASGITTVERFDGRGFPLHAALRTSINSYLPLRGALTVHSAGIVRRGQGMLFFGESGAGKSTLSATVMEGDRLLSDELVAVRVKGESPTISSTGFWGNSELRRWEEGEFPLVALFDLAKGPEFRLEPLTRGEAARLLLKVIMAPVVGPIWKQVLPLADRLVAAVPAYRMYWTPSDPPWRHLDAFLAED